MFSFHLHSEITLHRAVYGLFFPLPFLYNIPFFTLEGQLGPSFLHGPKRATPCIGIAASLHGGEYEAIAVEITSD